MAVINHKAVRRSLKSLRSQVGAAMVGYQSAATEGPEAQTVADKLYRFIDFLDHIPKSQHAAIKAGTSVYNCDAAFVKALASYENDVTLAIAPSSVGSWAIPEIRVPAGLYNFASTIELDRMVRLRGEGGSVQGGYSTVFKFAANTTGIRVKAYNTSGETTETPPYTGSGGGSIIEGLGIFGTSGSTTGHGVRMRVGCTIRDCVIGIFGENGVDINVTAGGGSSTEGNANVWRMERVKLVENGGHGLYVIGADVNAGCAISLDITRSGKCGILDASFLGNTYIGCHTEGNGIKARVHYGGTLYYCIHDTLGGATTPGTDDTVWHDAGAGVASSTFPEWVSGATYFIGSSYRSTNANGRNLFLNCYAEGGQGPVMILNPAMFFGGLTANGFETASTGLVLQSHTINNLTFAAANGSDRTINVRVGEPTVSNNILSFLADGDHAQGLAYRWTESSFTWGMFWASSIALMQMTSALSTEAAGRSAAIGGGKLLFPNGFWLSGSGGYRQVSMRTAAPVSGNSGVGDIHFNSAAVPGGSIGWVCTTAGTPGTFHEFGRIAGGGGTITQATSKSTGVTLAKRRGQITMHNANLAAGTTATFTLTNSLIGADDTIVVHRKSGGSASSYNVWVDSVAAGSCVICVRNITAGDLAEAPLLQFEVFAGAIA